MVRVAVLVLLAAISAPLGRRAAAQRRLHPGGRSRLGGHEPYGSTFHDTLNITRLAQRGMTFTNAYAARARSARPTRCSIISGMSGRVGIATPTVMSPKCGLPPRLRLRNRQRARSWFPSASPAWRPSTRHSPSRSRPRATRPPSFGKWHLGKEPYSPLPERLRRGRASLRRLRPGRRVSRAVEVLAESRQNGPAHRKSVWPGAARSSSRPTRTDRST